MNEHTKVILSPITLLFAGASAVLDIIISGRREITVEEKKLLSDMAKILLTFSDSDVSVRVTVNNAISKAFLIPLYSTGKGLEVHVRDISDKLMCISTGERLPHKEIKLMRNFFTNIAEILTNEHLGVLRE